MDNIIQMMMGAAGVSTAQPTDPYFNQTTLLLHGDGTNGAQNNTFLDSSTNNFTITRNGNTTQGTFSPFSGPNGYWSNFFDGSGDDLDIPDNSALDPGTGDFTIEAWVYHTASGNTEVYFNVPTNGLNFYKDSSNKLVVGQSGVGSLLTSTNTVPLNQWVHVAASRSGTSIKVFINGTQDGAGTNSTNLVANAGNGDIGSAGGAFYMAGYISNLRLLKGTALYTGSFTVPTAPLTAISNTSLLSCQSNRFVDNSTNNFAITPAGNVAVQPFSPFLPSAAYDSSVNGGSGYFDGNGDYLSIADAAGLRFGTGNFTIQCWIYRNAAGAVHSIAAKGGASTGWVFQVHSDNKLRFTHTTTNIDSTGTIPASAWTHVAVVREGTGTNQVKLYINGVQDGQGTVSTNFNQTEQLNIGADRGNSNVMNGYISGWKYVVGTAETITVPTAPPTGGTALLNFTNAGIFDNTGKNNLETVGDAQIDTSVKKYGTGSMEFDGTGDWLVAPSRATTSLDGNFTIEAWAYLNSTAAWPVITIGDSNTATGIELYRAQSNGKWRVYNNNTSRIDSTTSTGTGSWVHLAVVRSSGSVKLYVDGTNEGSAWSTTGSFSGAIYVGAEFFNGSVTVSANGYIDDLRITKGIARYTANFTPPSQAFPNL